MHRRDAERRRLLGRAWRSRSCWPAWPPTRPTAGCWPAARGTRWCISTTTRTTDAQRWATAGSSWRTKRPVGSRAGSFVERRGGGDVRARRRRPQRRRRPAEAVQARERVRVDRRAARAALGERRDGRDQHGVVLPAAAGHPRALRAVDLADRRGHRAGEQRRRDRRQRAEREQRAAGGLGGCRPGSRGGAAGACPSLFIMPLVPSRPGPPNQPNSFCGAVADEQALPIRPRTASAPSLMSFSRGSCSHNMCCREPRGPN